jgi:hypothetical protein
MAARAAVAADEATPESGSAMTAMVFRLLTGTSPAGGAEALNGRTAFNKPRFSVFRVS